MKNSLLTIIRNEKTDMSDFRRASEKMTHILAQESFKHIKEKR